MNSSRIIQTLSADKNSDAETICPDDIRSHICLFGHRNLGPTELRTFEPAPPLVAYVDNPEDAVRLCWEISDRCSGIYAGAQPRPSHFLDLVPNCWKPARSGPNGNCTCDNDIEFITTVFFDIDVVSDGRSKGHPASDEELARSLHAAELLSREDGMAMSSTICCSGNGHYVLAPIVPIPVYNYEEAAKFKQFCMQMAAKVAAQVSGVKFDCVFNLSRVMRVIGTINRKGEAIEGRPYRRAHFVTEPVFTRSEALHHMILNTVVEPCFSTTYQLPKAVKCDLSKIEECAFISYCRRTPEKVSEPQWFALIANLARLEGGPELIHQISALDRNRYDCLDTERMIRHVIGQDYKPVSCRTLHSEAMTRPGRGRFSCWRIGRCPAKAPMYMAISHTVYQR